ncbi:MAG: hypothetical protein ACLTAO_01440 [Christensenellales bacterium]
MIARHITSHDENGMRLLGIGREIHRTPTQQALENLAMDLASREGSVIYAQQRCMDGAAISKAYHCEGRVIVDSVYFSTIEELKRLYTRTPLGDGLFFAAASTLGRPTALPSPASEALKSDASFDEFADAVNSLFPDEDALADVICALRTPILPLAVMGDMPDGEFSRKLYMALELILRSLPADAAARLDFITLCGGEGACAGLTGYTADENPECDAYISLPDGARSIDAIPSQGDYARADALLAGTLDDIMDASIAGDGAPAAAAAPAPRPRPQPKSEPQPVQPVDTDCADSPALSQIDLDKAQQTLSASLRYANSHEFRRFTTGFLHLRASMEPQLYFRYCLKYSDYLHRLDHPMCEVYDAELAALYQQPPAGLMAVQIALTLTGYPGALRGAIKHLDRAGVLDRFISDTLPRMNVGDKPEEYALTLLSIRATLKACVPDERRTLVTDSIAKAVNESLPGAIRRVSAAALCSVRDALDSLIDEEPALGEGAFDPAMSEIIDRIEFKRMDEHAEETYPALDFAYSYVRQWDGQVTDKQRAICLWGRLMSGCSDWHGCVMEGALRLRAHEPGKPRGLWALSTVFRRDVRRRAGQDSDKRVGVIITMLTALRFDSQNNWRIDELGDVLERLGDAGEGLVREFWQQVDTRVDLLPVDMLNAAHDVADGRGAQTLRPTRGRSQREDDDYADDDYLDSPRSRYAEMSTATRVAPVRGQIGLRRGALFPRGRARTHGRHARARPRIRRAAGDARLGFVQRARGQRPSIGRQARAQTRLFIRPGRSGRRPRRTKLRRRDVAVPCRKPPREEALVRGHGDAGRAGDCGHRVGGVLRRQVSEIVRSNPFRNGILIETPPAKSGFCYCNRRRNVI